MSFILESKKFDAVSLTSSSMYFLILAIYLIFMLTDSITNKKTKDTFNGLRIITLILPIIYFCKLGYLGLKDKNTNTIQKFLLGIYFLLVVILLSLDIAEGDKKEYIYAMIYISPLLIITSFYLSYEQWKGGLPKYVVLLSFFLALLYYTSFYDFLIQSNDYETNKSIFIIQTIISFILFLLFGYMAYITFDVIIKS